MSQKRRHSILEVCCSVATGFIIAVLLWEFVIEPVYGIDKNFTENLGITGIFTVASIIRGYIWRRLFNKQASA